MTATLDRVPWQIRFFGPVTYTAAAFVQPAVGGDIEITIDKTSGLVVDQWIFIANGGFYRVVSLEADSQTLVLVNPPGTSGLGIDDNAAPGSTVPSGSLVSPAGPQGAAGTVAFTGPAVHGVTTSLPIAVRQVFTWDASGGTVAINMPNTTAIGTCAEGHDASDATSLTNTVTFTDPHGYKFRDPDSRVLTAGATLVLTAPRDLTFTLVHSASLGTFWSTG